MSAPRGMVPHRFHLPLHEHGSNKKKGKDMDTLEVADAVANAILTTPWHKADIGATHLEWCNAPIGDIVFATPGMSQEEADALMSPVVQATGWSIRRAMIIPAQTSWPGGAVYFYRI